MKQIALLITSLIGGGAERQILKLAEELSKECEVTLFLLEKNREYALPRSVTTRVLSNTKSTNSQIRRLLSLIASALKLRREERYLQADLRLSYLELANFINIAVSRSKGLEATISTRVHLSSHYRGIRYLVTRILMRWLYPKATYIMPNSELAREDIIHWLKIAQEKAILLPNAIDYKEIDRKRKEPLPAAHRALFKNPVIIASGRLVKQKGFEELIRSFGYVAREEEKAQLVILGKGPLEGHLHKVAKQLGIAERVHLLGHVCNPFPYYAHARLFVLSSFYEGFPNVLLEAMACGTPCIATNCPSGPCELIRNKKEGILVPMLSDERAIGLLGKEIRMLLQDKRRAQMISAAGKRRVASFTPSRTAKIIERLMERSK